MDALRERTESLWTLTWLAHRCFLGTDGVLVDVNMVSTWMLWQWMGSECGVTSGSRARP